MNAVKAFIDTNLLVYLYSHTEQDKSRTVVDVLCKHECIISTQVLNEFCHVCIRKMKISPADVKKAIMEIIAVCRLAYIKEQEIFLALKIQNDYGYSYYDSLIIASALESGCQYLFSEDMADGQMIENKVRIKNIFHK
jgi:predicted nucleic acid-binding protein